MRPIPQLVGRISTAQRVSALVVGLVLVDVFLLAALAGGEAVFSDVDVSIVVIAGLFALVEWRVVHIQFRAEASSFSLLEIPLVLGLLYESPGRLLVATTIGVSAGLMAGRRQAPIKVVFNVANLVLYASVAILVLDGLPHGNIDRWVWLSVLAAVLVGSATSFVSILLAVTLTEGFPSWRKSAELLSFGLVVSLANATIGLTAAVILKIDFFGLLLLGVPGVLLFSAFRMIAAEREQRERVEFLYRSTRRLDVGGSEDGLLTLLREARDMFRAEISTVVLLDEDKSRLRVVRSATDDDGSQTWESSQEKALVAASLDALNGPTLLEPNASGPIRQLVTQLGGRDAMVVKLTTDQRDLGLLVIANRLGEVTSFTANDLQVLGALARQSAVLMHSDRLELALTELRKLERQLAYQATHDSLTGLPNRSAFVDALQLASADGERYAVLFLDLDGFKSVNDAHGHSAGDAVLVEVSARLRRAVRPVDTVARFGGDEFAVLLLDAPGARRIADRIVSELAEPIVIDGDLARIGCSVGIALGQAGTDIDRLMQNADAAMYRAKQAGKGTLVEHDQTASIGPPGDGDPDLRLAIEDHQLELHYQPIVDVAGRRIRGTEALVRWRSPDRGLLMPGDFLGVAERNGMITEIDRWVVDQVARDFGSEALEDDFFVSINLSARDLDDGLFVEWLSRPVMDPIRSHLVIEWPESVLIAELDNGRNDIERIRGLGVGIALDGFGTGYSSLGYLERFEIDLLKLGRSLTDRLDGTDRDRLFVKSILDAGHALGLEVVAEGVETNEQLRALTDFGCEMAQGFLFARPMMLNEIRPFLHLRPKPAPPPKTSPRTPMRFG